jgi:transcriptional regulator with XRE-family HTH domain
VSRPVHPIVAQLRQIRIDRGLTQGAVARRMGRARRTPSEWERGNYTPSVEAAAELADALGMTLTLAPKQTREGAP